MFFGNVGGAERLDVTVIGRAVDAASRVEALSRALGSAILLTEPVARGVDCPLDHPGEHALRGLPAPVAIYGPSDL